jgi:hypothetical protein
MLADGVVDAMTTVCPEGMVPPEGLKVGATAAGRLMV